MKSQLFTPWSIVGFFGQALFSGRFIVQWIASERRRASVVPGAFWWLSIGGSLCLLAYAIQRRDPVFILGQSAGLVVYARNIMLRKKGTIPYGDNPLDRSPPRGA